MVYSILSSLESVKIHGYSGFAISFLSFFIFATIRGTHFTAWELGDHFVNAISPKSFVYEDEKKLILRFTKRQISLFMTTLFSRRSSSFRNRRFFQHHLTLVSAVLIGGFSVQARFGWWSQASGPLIAPSSSEICSGTPPPGSRTTEPASNR
jgi:hypothetical protein